MCSFFSGHCRVWVVSVFPSSPCTVFCGPGWTSSDLVLCFRMYFGVELFFLFLLVHDLRSLGLSVTEPMRTDISTLQCNCVRYVVNAGGLYSPHTECPHSIPVPCTFLLVATESLQDQALTSPLLPAQLQHATARPQQHEQLPRT